MWEWIGYYLFGMNIYSFLRMGADKRRARRGTCRISERELLMLAVIGGSIGSFLAMYIFRHKTKHIRFVIGVPFIFLLQVAMFIFLYRQI